MPNDKKNSKNVRTGFFKTSALIAVLIITAALSAYFLLSPMLEKQRMLDRQAELLESIKFGTGVIVLDESLATGSVDFYDSGEDESPEPDAHATLAAVEATQTMGQDAAATTDMVITGIGIFTIEKIDLTLPVTDGVSESQLKIAVGHVPQTATIGETGNAVIAGHRSYTYGQYFNRLGELEVGDIILYQPKDGDAMEFEVYEILEVLPEDSAVFEQPEDKQVLTLYTCTPIRTATHRLLVRAERIV